MQTEKPKHPIAIYRKANGLSQADLAAQVRCGRWMLNRIENGERSPSTALLGRIVEATGLSADVVMGWVPREAAE